MQEPNRPLEYARAYRMEDEIDLRAYVELMLRRWWWIGGCAVLAAVAAFAISSSAAPTYEAASVVLITEPRYQMQFEPRFESVDRWERAYRAFPELAISDGLLQGVVDAYQPSPTAEIENWRLGVLKGMTEATPGEDERLVKLKVSSRSPEDAAGIANVWADKLVERGNRIYGESEEDVTFFEDQAAQAEQALEAAEQALIAFRARDRASLVSTQLSSYRQTQADYLTDQRTITYLIQDIQGLRDQLARQPGGQPAFLGDELTSLFLQVKAFNTQVSAPTELQVNSDELSPLFLQVKAFNTQGSAPIQFQVNSDESLPERSRAEQVSFLEDLAETLEAKSGAIEERSAEVEPKILESQEELQEIETERQRLERALTLATETYMTVSRRLEEARIAAQEANGVLQVGSYAAVPLGPAGQGRLKNTALAGVVGGLIGLGAVFALEWWREGAEEPGK